jgi:SAM-dependent methyltransferase
MSDGHPWLAATIDWTMRPLYPARRLVVPEAKGRVLEVGVGTGLNFGLYRDVTSLAGVDPDPHMLARARARVAELPFPVELHQTGAERLPFPTTTSTPPSSRSRSARFPIRRPRSPRCAACCGPARAAVRRAHALDPAARRRRAGRAHAALEDHRRRLPPEPPRDPSSCARPASTSEHVVRLERALDAVARVPCGGLEGMNDSTDLTDLTIWRPPRHSPEALGAGRARAGVPRAHRTAESGAECLRDRHRGARARRRAARRTTRSRAATIGVVLHGIPIGLKDLVQTAGIRTSCGSKVHGDWVPDADAAGDARARGGGRVLLGKQSTHEYAFGVTTNNPHFGPTRNPWNRDRIPGGSSGGAGASVAAHLACAAIGTDTGWQHPHPGGGVRRRRPEAHVRAREQGGRVPDVVPLRSRRAARAHGRGRRDRARAIAGYDAADPTTVPVPVSDYRGSLARGVRGLRIGVPRTKLFAPIDPGVLAAVDAAIATLARLGATVRDVEIPELPTPPCSTSSSARRRTSMPTRSRTASTISAATCGST